ncbi:hypothetical protein EV363DRAFT_756729 [Boletus edulis]|uniref:Uncharacterized protein n=1 Tax=Boletus edulis BED1 TaxID=1328754 RepID=A0AAD4BPT6_BOLED|nr:hypothetical protein EV363DRAFT_756729 [Boletus edulis]KAF8436208.1 hypothetical protein L210DRAFT_2473784 [Boletus edulis BED1]
MTAVLGIGIGWVQVLGGSCLQLWTSDLWVVICRIMTRAKHSYSVAIMKLRQSHLNRPCFLFNDFVVRNVFGDEAPVSRIPGTCHSTRGTRTHCVVL